MGSVTHTWEDNSRCWLLGIIGGGVPPSSPNPDPIFSPKNVIFQRGEGEGGARIYMLCGLYKGVPPSLRDDKDYVLFTCTVNRQFSFSIQLSLFFLPLNSKENRRKVW